LGGSKKGNGFVAKIVFSKIARLDLKEIIDFIKRDSVKYAYLEKKKIEEAIEKLFKHPTLGRVVPELNDESLREFIIGNYRIIYQIISTKQINVVTIHHHARLFRNNPAFGDED
jgi:toxin ParE1/3/4